MADTLITGSDVAEAPVKADEPVVAEGEENDKVETLKQSEPPAIINIVSRNTY